MVSSTATACKDNSVAFAPVLYPLEMKWEVRTNQHTCLVTKLASADELSHLGCFRSRITSSKATDLYSCSSKSLKSMLTSSNLRQMVPAVDRLAPVTGRAGVLSESSDSLLESDATAAEPFLSALETGLTACWTATLVEDCLDRGRLCGDLALIIAGGLAIGVTPCTATLLSQWPCYASIQPAACQIDNK